MTDETQPVEIPNQPNSIDFPLVNQRRLTPIEETLRDHIQGLIGLSKQYNDKITTAKTKPKKDFYRKKLVKNNKEIVKYIFAAERLRQKHSEITPNDNANDIEESSQSSATTASGVEQLRIEDSL